MSTLREPGRGIPRAGYPYLARHAALWCAPFVLAALLVPFGAADGQPPAEHHKVEARGGAGAQLLAEGGRLIADYGGYQLYDVTALPSGAETQARDEYNLVQLQATTLDTSKLGTQALRRSIGSFSGKRLHLVQFAGPVQPAWREALLQAGVRIVSYVPQNAYLVYGDARALTNVQAFAASTPQVQWDGPFLDDYRLHPAARPVDSLGNPREIGTDLFAIQLVADGEANAATLNLLDQLKLQPVHSRRSPLGYLNVIASVAPTNLARLAAQPDVVSIHPYFRPRKLDERQAQIVAGNLVGNVPSGPGYLNWLASKGFTQAQFDASNFAVDVTDSGIDDGTTFPNHPGLYVQGNTAKSSRVIYNRLEGSPNIGSTLVGCDGHGTLNSHVIGGYDDIAGFPHTDTIGYHYGLGICPFVRLGSSVIFDPDFFTFPDLTDLQSRAYQNGARVSNNSWGADTSGAYDLEAQEYDALVRDAQPAGAPFAAPGNQEMVIVFAAGNAGQSGPQSVGSPGSAKNVLTVGAGENVLSVGGGGDGCGVTDSGADSANDIIFFSSRGPCEDGRHKPDIVAPGTHVTGGVAQAPNPGTNGTADPCFVASGVCGTLTSMFFPDGQEFFTISSGTSHSTPCVVGGCALLRQWFLNMGSNAPSPAMTKAYLINSTRYMTGANANDTLWSDNQGMGGMDLGTAFDGVSRVLHDEVTSEMFTASGQSRTFSGVVADSTKALRVTLAWSDAPGSTTGNAYNNNLDLTVTIGGTTYKGNVFRGGTSVSGGSADTRNNVESVFLPAGMSGPITVTVTAVNINSDGVPNNSTPLDQDFALVMYNCKAPPPVISGIQPPNLTVLNAQPAAFTVTATGTAPLLYQWRKDGSALASATASVFAIAAAQTNDSGAYSVIVSDINGASTSPTANLTVVPTIPLAIALNNTNLPWTSTNPVPWYGQSLVSHDNQAAARSYFIGDNQQSILTTTTNGPGTLSFWWKVSSQTNRDALTFRTAGNGSTYSNSISGEVDWTNQTYLLPAGPQVVQWTYAKDLGASSGLDAGFLDQVSFAPGATLPTIIVQPQSQGTLAAQPVTFTVSATGTPALNYQWRFSGADIPGATNSSLTLANPSGKDTGTYSVLVANPYGSALSSNAYLGVVPLVVSGDNSLGQIQVSAVATNAIQVAAGAWHTLVLRSDGTVLAWGEDYSGQCDVPPGLHGALAIAAGGYHSLAVGLDGRVIGWGDNSYGQISPPPGLTNATVVAAGSWHSLALRANGTVVAWGDDSLGQTDVPAGLANVIAIAAGGNHSLALRADRSIVAWGENTDASGNFVGQSTIPWGLSNVVAIGAGDYHSLAAKADGSVLAWGDNSQGQCDLQPLTNIVAVAGGGFHSVALGAGGTVAAWGDNWNGQCTFPPNVSNVVQIATGDSHTILLVGNGPGGPQILRARRSGNQFRVLVQTFSGNNYALEFKSSLIAAGWTAIVTNYGNGALQFLTDPAANGPQRFYRVRQW